MQDQTRLKRGIEIAQSAGDAALAFFRAQDSLTIERKGLQDFVSQADREVETLVRTALAGDFPEDGIVGEEHDTVPGTSGFTWVVDPIDGTANFINAMPLWCVVLAGVRDGRVEIGIIHDPNHGETYVAQAGQGATLNGHPLRMPQDVALNEGSVSVGYSHKVPPATAIRLTTTLLEAGCMFNRNGSGALSLAWTAAGRFIGFAECHMNAWDCLAGQLLVAEAGGRIEDQDARDMIAHGGRVIAANPLVFDDLRRLALDAFAP